MPRCPHCRGVGFISGVFLITKYSDVEVGTAWTTKQELTTREQIQAVRSHLQPNQMIVEGAEMCECHPGRGSDTGEETTRAATPGRRRR